MQTYFINRKLNGARIINKPNDDVLDKTLAAKVTSEENTVTNTENENSQHIAGEKHILYEEKPGKDSKE